MSKSWQNSIVSSLSIWSFIVFFVLFLYYPSASWLWVLTSLSSQIVTSMITHIVKFIICLLYCPVLMIYFSIPKMSFRGFLMIKIEWSLISRNGMIFCISYIDGSCTILTPLLLSILTWELIKLMSSVIISKCKFSLELQSKPPLMFCCSVIGVHTDMSKFESSLESL